MFSVIYFLKDEATAQKLIASVDDQEIRKELVVDLTVSRQQISKEPGFKKIREKSLLSLIQTFIFTWDKTVILKPFNEELM